MTLQSKMNNNLVRYMELIPGTSAFIDARTPGSDLKDNFCIIGALATSCCLRKCLNRSPAGRSSTTMRCTPSGPASSSHRESRETKPRKSFPHS